MNSRDIKIIECPRDAMQGISQFISTEHKIDYINLLLKCGFDTIDFGSFVSAKTIPQMADTHKVLQHLDLSQTQTKLLAIIANERGAEDALQQESITYLGFPYSVSETFQVRNTNRGSSEAFDLIQLLQNKCVKHGKELVVYISMAFGNPYGDHWNCDLILEESDKLSALGIKTISLADTIGLADPESIFYLYSHLVPGQPHVEFGAHFHTQPDNWKEKIDAALKGGCKRFDGAIKGFGGCPMAKDELVGNMDTINLYHYFEEMGYVTGIQTESFMNAIGKATEIFI